jgi:hypothetical protein
VRPVDRLREATDLERQGRFVDPRRRRDLGAEDPHVEAPEASERAETVALPLRKFNRGVPVRTDAELLRRDTPAPIDGDEDDRGVVQRPRPPSQKSLGIAGFHTSHVHAVDANTGGNPPRRAREDQAEHRARDRQKEKCERAALDAHARRSPPPAPAARGDSA